MTARPPAKSSDVMGELAAFRRAAKAAHDLAQQKGTSCYVEIDGKIVDIAAKRDAKSKSKRPAAKKK